MVVLFDVFAPDHNRDGSSIGAEQSLSDAVDLIQKRAHSHPSGRPSYSQQIGDKTFFNVQMIDGVVHVSVVQ
jgi:hypothetical protein